MGKTEDFSEEDRIKVLLWCDRHCCLCGKECGTIIEIHHIEQKGENLSDIDNAIPLCRNCHGKIESYDPKHPVGTSDKIKEIKARRDQIYDKYTRHLVPPLVFYLTPRLGDRRSPQIRLPKVGFVIENHGLFLPTKIKVNI
ncbi:MAG: HNH endonuclease [Candidatus Bathyarchaeota archaeon]|nr:HNH endonuclease [Candidatus Bathyarchaeota archaeon]